MSAPPEEIEEEKQAPSRRRRWPRVLLVLFLLLIGGLLWLNGPGARMLIGKFAPEQLEKFGLTGTYEVSGQLHSGLTIRNIDLSGDQMIQKAKADLISVNYSLPKVIKGKANSLTIHGLDLVIDLDQLPESEEKEKVKEKKEEPAKPLMETLNSVRGFVEPIAIDLQNIKIRTKKESFFGRLAIESLTHASGSSDIILTGLETETTYTKTHNSPPATIVWKEDLLTLDQLDPVPDLGIRDLALDQDSFLKTDLLLANTPFLATSNLTTTHSIVLKDAPFDLKSIASYLPKDLEIKGLVTSLDVQAAFPDEGQRKLKVNVQATDIKYETYLIKTLSTQANLNNDDAAIKLATSFEISDTAQGDFTVEGTGRLDKELPKSIADLDWKLVTKEYPTLDGTARWAEEKANLTVTTLEKVALKAGFDPATQLYTAEASSALNDARELYPDLAVAKFTLTGEGDLKAGTHTGQIDIQQVNYAAKEAPVITASGKGSWNWPEQFSFQNLIVKRDGIEARSSLTWKEGFARISELRVADDQGSLVSGKGSLPLPLQARNLDDLLENKEPIDFAITFEPTPLSRFAEGFGGNAQAALKLSGTFANPLIDGSIKALKVKNKAYADLPATDLYISLTTEAKKIVLTGSLVEPGGRLLNLAGRFPLEPAKWIEDPDSLMKEPLSFSADTPRIDLRRFEALVPTVKDLAGVAEINVKGGGTIEKPDLSGEVFIQADRARLRNSPISDFRSSRVRLKFRNDTITIAPSQITAAGGVIGLSGSIKLGEKPLIDVSLRGDNVLLWRDSAYTLRADPSLTLKGPFDSARLAGSIPLVESIVYKDVEILPFGVPTTKEIERPNIPDLSAAANQDLYSLPEPFSNWPVDIALTTKDPVLVRGNLVKGEIIADTRIGGTLGKVTTSGTISTRDLEADLPFSKLLIQNASINLNPKTITEPTVSIRGTAKVSGYDVQIYVSGSVSKPALVITSEPPLPESEILLLLSTGSTSSTLNNRSVASQKALQYLIQGLRKRYGKQDAKSLVQRLLKNLDEVDLSLGDYNRFSGRHSTSATIDISDEWAFSTSIDEEGNTRSIVIFSLRFE